MRKFAVFSGFLGSGKTSTMMALTQYYTEHHGKAAMISNDLGGQGLADHRLAKLQGCNASEITGECICFCHEALLEHLNSFYDAGCELVVSDIPGFGVGALEHVYHGMEADYPGQLELAPFTVVALMRGFVILGGFFMQPDIVDAAILHEAQRNPNNYQNLSVRVSGWNARFVTLNKEWQDMIISQNESGR